MYYYSENTFLLILMKSRLFAYMKLKYNVI